MAAGTQVELPTQGALVFLLPPCGRGILQQFDSCGELYNVLCPRQGPLWGSMVLLTVQLGQLQNWHVAQWTHFPNLQPLNKAPAE